MRPIQLSAAVVLSVSLQCDRGRAETFHTEAVTC